MSRADEIQQEIDRVAAYFPSTYRRGIIAGLRQYLSVMRGPEVKPSCPAHYIPRSAKTFREGVEIGWNRAHRIATPTPEPGHE